MIDAPSALQLDALREVANIGCGHAAGALSHLVGGTVRIDVPRVVTASAAAVHELVGGEAPVVAVVLDIQGDVLGRMALLWPEADAAGLARVLLEEEGEGGLNEEPRRSALTEVGNIVGSACLSAIGTLARLRLLPSTPRLVFDTAEEVVEGLISDRRSQAAAVVLEARFFTQVRPVLAGQMLVVPERAGLPKLFRALGIS